LLFREAVEGHGSTEKFFIGVAFVILTIDGFYLWSDFEIDNSVQIDHDIQKLIL
jgi:hypothetical protein